MGDTEQIVFSIELQKYSSKKAVGKQTRALLVTTEKILNMKHDAIKHEYQAQRTVPLE